MAFSSRNILVILVRGLAFRGGGRASQDPSAPLEVSSSPDEQILALRSLQQHVIAPARTLGWRVGLAIDVVMPSHLHSAWQQAKSASGLRAATIERISETYRKRTQSESMVDMMIWANRTGPAEWGSRSAMLISRADLVFRKPLPLPAPPDEDGKLMLPFRMISRKSNLTRCATMWSELLIYVPRRLDPSFISMLVGLANRQGENLHSFGRSGIPEAEVRAFAPDANASPDSAHTYNPVYYIIGRNQSTRIAPPADCPLGHRESHREAGRMLMLGRKQAMKESPRVIS